MCTSSIVELQASFWESGFLDHAEQQESGHHRRRLRFYDRDKGEDLKFMSSLAVGFNCTVARG